MVLARSSVGHLPNLSVTCHFARNGRAVSRKAKTQLEGLPYRATGEPNPRRRDRPVGVRRIVIAGTGLRRIKRAALIADQAQPRSARRAKTGRVTGWRRRLPAWPQPAASRSGRLAQPNARRRARVGLPRPPPLAGRPVVLPGMGLAVRRAGSDGWAGDAPSGHRAGRSLAARDARRTVRFAPDSPLEGSGFELPVPLTWSGASGSLPRISLDLMVMLEVGFARTPCWREMDSKHRFPVRIKHKDRTRRRGSAYPAHSW